MWRRYTDDQGHSDLVHTTGAATLNGGTLNVQPQSGDYHAGMTYQFLQADGGVSGRFDSVVLNLPSFHSVLMYGSNAQIPKAHGCGYQALLPRGPAHLLLHLLHMRFRLLLIFL